MIKKKKKAEFLEEPRTDFEPISFKLKVDLPVRLVHFEKRIT